MEIVVKIISISILVFMIYTPFLLYRLVNRPSCKYPFIAYLVFGLMLSIILTLVLAWWGDRSNRWLMSFYGYDFDDMDSIGRYEHVAPENLEMVKRMRVSMMGVGWPLKAIFCYILYGPYLLFVYLVRYFFKK